MRVVGMRLEHPRVSSRYTTISASGLSDDGGAWRPVSDGASGAGVGMAGRTLFTFASGASELALGGVSARGVRLEARLPFRGEGAITSLCVRTES